MKNLQLIDKTAHSHMYKSVQGDYKTSSRDKIHTCNNRLFMTCIVTQNPSFRKPRSETRLVPASKPQSKIRKSHDKLFDRLANPAPDTSKYDKILKEAKERHRHIDTLQKEIDKEVRKQEKEFSRHLASQSSSQEQIKSKETLVKVKQEKNNIKILKKRNVKSSGGTSKGMLFYHSLASFRLYLFETLVNYNSHPYNFIL